MARTPWTLTDNSTGTPVVLEFDINPKEADYPGREANFVQEHGSSPSSAPIIFQGRDGLPTFSFVAMVRGQTNYSDMELWVNKWYPMVLEDDLGNTWTVVFRRAGFKRQNRYIQPWTFELTADMLVLS
jgi:hypothetical protein